MTNSIQPSQPRPASRTGRSTSPAASETVTAAGALGSAAPQTAAPYSLTQALLNPDSDDPRSGLPDPDESLATASPDETNEVDKPVDMFALMVLLASIMNDEQKISRDITHENNKAAVDQMLASATEMDKAALKEFTGAMLSAGFTFASGAVSAGGAAFAPANMSDTQARIWMQGFQGVGSILQSAGQAGSGAYNWYAGQSKATSTEDQAYSSAAEKFSSEQQGITQNVQDAIRNVDAKLKELLDAKTRINEDITKNI